MVVIDVTELVVLHGVELDSNDSLTKPMYCPGSAVEKSLLGVTKAMPWSNKN